jgi:hypothetical protein
VPCLKKFTRTAQMNILFNVIKGNRTSNYVITVTTS